MFTIRPYQEEYIKNVKEYISLTLRPGPKDKANFGAYAQRLLDERARKRQLAQRNMELLRGELLPTLDRLSEVDREERRELQDFSTKLLANPKQVDVGLACQIQEALLAQARQEDNLDGIIEHLYWLGISRFNLANKLANMGAQAAPYYDKLRACFQEATDHLEEFDKIENDETRSYIIRSAANRALGHFPTVADRIRLLKEIIGIMENPGYRALAPGLPWDRYVTQAHRLMVSSISHSRDGNMTPQDVADIMRSVYTFYRGMDPTPRQMFHRTAIEYYCGVYDLDYLLRELEYLTDSASARDFSSEGAYALVSLPAFYCLYLSEYPERVGERERYYLAGLYQRVQSYLNAFPEGKEDEDLFFFLRQLLATFIEVPTGIPYGQFLSWLLLHFSPEVRIHSRIVAEAAKALCGFVLDRDEGFFDGIGFLHDLKDPAEKRKAVLDYAEGCGLFHDVGKVNCLELHTRIARQWFPMEGDMAQLHTLSGYEMLRGRPSTSRYAAIALGHHAWYDGSDMLGYPADYRREDHSERRMVDVIALCDLLSDAVNPYTPAAESDQAFDAAVERARRMAGRQFSPRLTALLDDPAVSAALRQSLDVGRIRADAELFAAAVK